MTVSYQASLFDAPPEPVVATGSDWVTGLLGGSIAVSLCVIAMAVLGMLMLTGRLHLRRGLQVVLGCFLLLGTPLLVDALTTRTDRVRDLEPAAIVLASPAPQTLRPVDNRSSNPFDPYSGATLPRR